MTRYENDEPDEYIKDSGFGFFELLFVACRYEYEPSSIDNEDDTDEHEESVHVRDDLANDAYSTGDILIRDLTASRRGDICRST